MGALLGGRTLRAHLSRDAPPSHRRRHVPGVPALMLASAPPHRPTAWHKARRVVCLRPQHDDDMEPYLALTKALYKVAFARRRTPLLLRRPRPLARQPTEPSSAPFCATRGVTASSPRPWCTGPGHRPEDERRRPADRLHRHTSHGRQRLQPLPARLAAQLLLRQHRPARPAGQVLVRRVVPDVNERRAAAGGGGGAESPTVSGVLRVAC